MILIKENFEYTIKHIDYDLLQVLIRGIEKERQTIADKIDELIIDQMNDENATNKNVSMIQFFKSMLCELDKIIKQNEVEII